MNLDVLFEILFLYTKNWRLHPFEDAFFSEMSKSGTLIILVK